jgi:hypothetical protein
VVLFSASIAGLILSLMLVDGSRLSYHISPRFARRVITWVVIGVSAMFLLLWLSRIVPFIASGAPPVGLESYTTLSVQGADLSLVIPLSMIAGVMLLRRQPIGYLLAVPVLVFLATMGLGLVGMVTAMAAMGTAVGVADYVPAVITAVVGVGMTAHYVLGIEQRETRPRPVQQGRGAGFPAPRSTYDRYPLINRIIRRRTIKVR